MKRKRAKAVYHKAKKVSPLRKILEKWGILVAVVMATAVVLPLISERNRVLPAKTEKGFDQYGYNNTGRIFNGTGLSWCQAKGLSPEWCADYLGSSINDKLVMKWNAEWDRGNDEGWNQPPYAAWTDNEWNGMAKGGSGSVWHYKISWQGSCNEGEEFPGGGYCIWGQFKVLMDQGSTRGVGHEWFAKSTPAGYGAR